MRPLVFLPLITISASGFAQNAPLPAATEADSADKPNPDQIVVIATRLVGQVDAPQAPIQTLEEADIAAYGASSLTDLLAALAPQTGSGRGRGSGFPVLLVNGQRIANFREMRNIPPEAIRRMEILPEEVALRFGYPPNQRVINMILKEHFASKSISFEYNAPSRGGFATSEVEATLLKIEKADRINLTAKVEDQSLLTEAARGVAQAVNTQSAVMGDPDPAANRSLASDTRDVTVAATWSKGLGDGGKGGSFSLNGQISHNDTRSLSGVNSVVLTAPGGSSALRTFGNPLARVSQTATVQGGAVFNKPLGGWQLSATVDASHSEGESLIDRRANTSALVTAASAGTQAINGALPAVPASGADRTVSNSDAATSLITITGRPLRLPAGDVVTTLKTGFAYTGLQSSDTRNSGAITSLRRGDLSAGINLGIPLTSRNENVLAGLGNMTVNLSAGADRLSDFGTLIDWSTGVTWSPLEKFSLQTSYIVNQAAPSLSNLGGAQIITLNVPIYDFTNGTTAVVSLISGGNPALRREVQRDLKLSATWEMPFLKNSNLVVEYFRNHSNDVTSSFPLLTPAIEAAFASRVTRDSSGKLVSIDKRPVTFRETTGSRVRYGFNLSGTIGKAPAGGRGGMMGGMGRPPGGSLGGPSGGGPRPGGGGLGGGPPMMAMMGGGGQGRWSLSIYHTIRFSEQVLVAPGGPLLDLLGGDALIGGGVARHTLEMEGGGFYKGFGLRFNGNWAAPTNVRASGTPGSSDLRFGAVFKLDLRLFAELSQKRQLVKAIPFLKGARMSLVADNVFDSRQRVTDANGAVPLSYQPDYLDPRGRFLGIDIRKMF